MKQKIALIVAAALAIASPALADNHVPTLNYNVVEFDESASVRVANDTMHVTLAIQENGKTREMVSDAVTRKLNAVQSKISENKQLIAELGSRNVYPKYNEKHQITHWEDSVEIHVKSMDFDAIAQLVANTQTWAMLDGISFSVSPEKRAVATEQASALALKAFQKRAQFISQSLGFSGYKLVKVDLNSRFEQANAFYQAPAPMMRAKASVANDYTPAIDVNPDNVGEQEIRQNVHVTIQMQ